MRVLAAMSGGVDSSVTAGLLIEEGHEVVGVHMKLHDVEGEAGGRHCCGLDEALTARRAAEHLGIPFYVMDLRAPFKTAVMDYFAESYRAGRTPNPCVACNGVLKFQVLLARARGLGCEAIATGHYAQIGPDGGLWMAADKDKDQSYFLFPMSREALASTRFPLGALAKPAVRALAHKMGLDNAEKPESQEVCFIPDDDHARFVREHLEVGPEQGSGEIVDEGGRVLGQHDGYWRFTVGQRRGLGVAAGQPLYVLSIDPHSRRVVLGPNDRLLHQSLRASAMRWLRPPRPEEAVSARIRHRGALHSCEIDGTEDQVQIRFQAPPRAATPGQAVVLYAGEEVLGGGWIDEVTG